VRVIKEKDGGIVRRVRLVDAAGEPVGPVCRFLSNPLSRASSSNTGNIRGDLEPAGGFGGRHLGGVSR
jgi:hypothetical protein